MKSLLDIQQDIRNLESSVQDITAYIRNIHSDINELRNSAQDAQSRDFDYEKIAILAGYLPFGKHPLSGLMDGRICQIYLEMLLNMIRMDHDAETTVNRMVFIQWLQIQSEIDWSLEELYQDACGMQLDFYDEFVEILPKKYAEIFMLDALIVANVGGQANREIFEYLAGLSVMLGIGTEQVQMLSSVATAVLCQKFQPMERRKLENVLSCAQEYKFYIAPNLFDDAIQRQREIVVQKPDDLRWNVKQGQEVKKGDFIAFYNKSGTYFFGKEGEKIKAPSSGVLFRFRDNNINYGVISVKMDDKDAIKTWVKAGGN